MNKSREEILAELVAALDRLLMCYRLNKRPSEKLLDEVKRLRKLADLKITAPKKPMRLVIDGRQEGARWLSTSDGSQIFGVTLEHVPQYDAWETTVEKVRYVIKEEV